MAGWYGCDFDATLAFYDVWNNGELGQPIPKMLERVRRHIENGDEVRIFTARVATFPGMSDESAKMIEEERTKIQDWAQKYLGVRLQVTCQKDYACILIYDDRARQVEPNTGKLIEDLYKTLEQENILLRSTIELLSQKENSLVKELRQNG